MYCMKARSPGWYPVSMAILMLVTVITSYSLAVVNGDADALFPYISDTGSVRPQSCIFGQFLNITSIMGILTPKYVVTNYGTSIIQAGVCVVIRFRLVQDFTEITEKKLKRLGIVQLVCGIATVGGLSMVANFQEVHCSHAHFTGAIICFLFGVIYSGLDTYITFKLNPRYNGILIAYIRLSISLVLSVFFVICCVSALISGIVVTGDDDHEDHRFTDTEPGYAAHAISSFTEWGLGAGFVAHFLTFTNEFDSLTVRLLVRPFNKNSHCYQTEDADRVPLIA